MREAGTRVFNDAGGDIDPAYEMIWHARSIPGRAGAGCAAGRITMEYAYERQIGSKTVLGTDHPIKVVVYRGKRREWVLAVICNGSSITARNFTTKRAAISSASGDEWKVGK